MLKTNSTLVSSDLFLDLELLMHNKTTPTLQTILNLNEIIELVALREGIYLPSIEHVSILRLLNNEIIKKMEKDNALDWEYEIKNLGKANLKRPLITTLLAEEDIILLDTEQKEERDYREFGEICFKKRIDKESKWPLKTIGLFCANSDEKQAIELSYLRGFNTSFNPEYFRMFLHAIPFIGDDLSKQTGNDYSWLYNNYLAVKFYSDFSKKFSLGLSDNILMQPFIALNSKPKEFPIDVLYKKLKEIRNTEIISFLDIQDPWFYYMPPLTTILLSRCRSFEDIPWELVKIRNEFEGLRLSLTKFHNDFANAETLKDKIEIKKQYHTSIEILSKKIKDPKKRIYKSIHCCPK